MKPKTAVVQHPAKPLIALGDNHLSDEERQEILARLGEHFPDVNEYLNKHSIDIMAFEELVEQLEREIARDVHSLRDHELSKRIRANREKRKKLVMRIAEMKIESRGAFTAVLPKIVKRGTRIHEKLLLVSKALEG